MGYKTLFEQGVILTPWFEKIKTVCAWNSVNSTILL